MKVELLVNLKVGSGRVISAGSVFTDATSPIPEFVMRRLKRGQARIIAEAKSMPAPSALAVKETPKKKSVEVKEVSGTKSKGKKLLKKKAEPAIG